MSTRQVGTIGELRNLLTEDRAQGKTIGCVPTMGALHDGHEALIRRATEECDCVVTTLFVNPIQFNDTADLEKYPRTLEEDLAICSRHNVDYLFMPPHEEMYPLEPVTFVNVESLTDGLCGKYRPGHFPGVTTVVTKLFNIVQPDRAYFGEKDFQQLAVIRRMVRDLNMPVEIVGVETIREPDGLAMSSRNERLTAKQRGSALTIYRSLQTAKRAIERGERDPAQLKEDAALLFERTPQLELEYFEVVDPETLAAVETVEAAVRIAAAAWAGKVRLIDNIAASPN